MSSPNFGYFLNILEVTSMITVVEAIRELCKEKNIPVSRLKKELGYGNGYLNPKKAKAISSDRLVRIAEYLGVTVDYILTLTGEDASKSPASGDDPETGLDEDQRSLLSIFDALPPDKKAVMLEMGKAFLLQEQAGRKDAQ